MIDQDSRRTGGLRAPIVEPAPPRGSPSFYLVVGVLIALVLSVGLLFADGGIGGGIGHHTDQAQQPERAMPERPVPLKTPPDIDLNRQPPPARQ